VTINLPEGASLTYTVMHEAWFKSVLDGERYLMVHASARGGGCHWEFQVVEGEISPHPSTRVKIFDDAYAAFTQIPEFFAALTAEAPGTLDGVRAILDRLGAVDETQREKPEDIR
jgi:hypothetical protein